MSEDNTAEFDPFFIERIKNCVAMMFEKDFVQQLELEIQTKHTYKNKRLAEDFIQRVVATDESNKQPLDTQNDIGNQPDVLRTTQKKRLDEEGGRLLTSRGNPNRDNKGK